MFHAEFEATNLCNTRCLHCPHEAMSRPRGRLSWDTFSTVVGQIRRHVKGEKYSLSFSGMGEPLLHPELPRFIAHVSHEATTSFACNGSLLTERNTQALRDAGLDMIYVSFNGDEPAVFEAMMGGIPFARVTRNLHAALKAAANSRLEIRANVSVTKQTQGRLRQIRSLLEDAGVRTITFSLAHSRGGNLDAPDVCDTPASPADLVHCDVIKRTLFIDWRGRAMICDHDLHGDHVLGDLMTEPLEDILARRQRLIDGGMPYPMCTACNDVLKGGFHLFRDGVGGILSDWIYALHAESDRPAFSEATPAQRWMLAIFRKENRLDRAVDRLLAVARELDKRLTTEETNREVLRGVLMQEIQNRDGRIRELEQELAAVRGNWLWRWREGVATIAVLLRPKSGASEVAGVVI